MINYSGCGLEVGISAFFFKGQGWTKGWLEVAGDSAANDSDAFFLAPTMIQSEFSATINLSALYSHFPTKSKVQDNSP
jgi:hypothetical protein